MGSSKKSTYAYRYYAGAHMVFGTGHWDRVIQIDYGDKVAWTGDAADVTIYLDNPNMLGGDQSEGGLQGNIAIHTGLPGQSLNSYLTTNLGSYCPAFRGVNSLVFEDMYWGTSPYFKAIAVTATRINKTDDGAEQWYIDKATVPVLDLESAQYDAYKQVSDAAPIWTITPPGGGSITLGHGWLSNARWKEGYPVGTTATLSVTLNFSDLSDEVEISLRIGHDDDGDLTADGATITSRVLVSTAEGRTYDYTILVPSDSSTVKLTATATNTVSSSAIGFFNVTMAVVPNTYQDGNMNPAHIVRELIVSQRGGMGRPAAMIDDTNFRAVADTLYDEGFGLSYYWQGDTTAEELCQDVLDTVGMQLYIHPKTKLYTLKLIRDDYDTDDLVTLGPKEIKKVESYKRPDPLALPNAVAVTYWNMADQSNATVQSIDSAAVLATGVIDSLSKDYSDGVTSGALAARIAQRERITACTPILSCKLTCSRAAADLLPGDAFLFDWPELHDDPIVMRVLKTKRGGIVNQNVIIECSEDVFTLDDESITDVLVANASNPSTRSIGQSVPLAIEAPYYEVLQRFGMTQTETFLASAPDAGIVLATAKRGANAVNAVVTEDGAAWPSYGDLSPSGTVNAAYGKTATALDITWDTEPATGSHIQIGAESLRYDGQNSSGLTLVGRGCLDTVPADIASGATAWAWDAFAVTDEVLRASGETVTLAVALRNESKQGSAITASTTMAARAIRPYPPANFKINGTSYPAEFTGDLALTWAHRNRVTQADTIVSTDAASITPESGTSYSISIYGDGGTLMRTVSTSDASYSYTTSMEASDLGVGVAGDSLISNVVSLLNFQGSQGSTTITDYVSRTWTVSGNAKIDTSLGFNTLALDGAGDYVTTAYSAASLLHWYGQANYTLEAWVYLNSLTGASYTDGPEHPRLIGNSTVGTGTNYWAFGPTQYGALALYYYTGSAQSLTSANGLITSGSWNHIALVKSGTTLTLYLNGASVAAGTLAGSTLGSVSTLVIGANNSVSSCFNGYVRALRMTNAVRYSGAFTPTVPPWPTTVPVSSLNSALRIKLKSRRDGFDSWQEINYTVARKQVGFGYNWGNNFGGNT